MIARLAQAEQQADTLRCDVVENNGSGVRCNGEMTIITGNRKQSLQVDIKGVQRTEDTPLQERDHSTY